MYCFQIMHNLYASVQGHYISSWHKKTTMRIYICVCICSNISQHIFCHLIILMLSISLSTSELTCPQDHCRLYELVQNSDEPRLAHFGG